MNPTATPSPSTVTCRPVWTTPAKCRLQRLRSLLLRPFVRPQSTDDEGRRLSFWATKGIARSLTAIARGRPLPTHLIAELRSGWLRRTLLRRQNRLDGVAVDYKTLYVSESFLGGGDWPYEATYSVPGQNKQYHWEEVAATASLDDLFAGIGARLHPETEEICYLFDCVAPGGVGADPFQHLEQMCLRLLAVRPDVVVRSPSLDEANDRFAQIFVDPAQHGLVCALPIS